MSLIAGHRISDVINMGSLCAVEKYSVFKLGRIADRSGSSDYCVRADKGTVANLRILAYYYIFAYKGGGSYLCRTGNADVSLAFFVYIVRQGGYKLLYKIRYLG